MPSEEKMRNPYPMPTAAEVRDWQSQTDPATAAARNVYARGTDGLMKRPFLRGDSDHAPVFKGVRDLVEAQMRLCLLIDEANAVEQRGAPVKLDAIIDANAEVMAILEHHGCSD